jgi:hypothetical protein
MYHPLGQILEIKEHITNLTTKCVNHELLQTSLFLIQWNVCNRNVE